MPVCGGEGWGGTGYSLALSHVKQNPDRIRMILEPQRPAGGSVSRASFSILYLTCWWLLALLDICGYIPPIPLSFSFVLNLLN